MTVHFINQKTKSDLSQEDIQELARQIKEGYDFVSLTDKDNNIYFFCKVSQILYIDNDNISR